MNLRTLDSLRSAILSQWSDLRKGGFTSFAADKSHTESISGYCGLMVNTKIGQDECLFWYPVFCHNQFVLYILQVSQEGRIEHNFVLAWFSTRSTV